MSKKRYCDISNTQNDSPLVPDSGKLIEHEIRSLEQLAKLKFFPKCLSDWKSKALSSSRQAKDNGIVNVHLSFSADDPHASSTEPKHTIELGAYIAAGDPPNVCYHFVIGKEREGGGYTCLRKLHIDFESNKASNEPKPIIHLQTPGRLWNALIEKGYDYNSLAHLYPKLDKPRIPCLPVSFAILLHIALLEYVSVDSQIKTFVNSPEWLSSITSSERFILRTFLKHSIDWIDKSENSSSSIISYFYRYP